MDYANESPSKVLGLSALVEAIHEFLDPSVEHDTDYLTQRIKLLRDVFCIGADSENSNAGVIDNLLFGYGQVSPVKILPFEGASEVPDTLDTKAHIEITEAFESELSKVRELSYQIQHAYIAFVVGGAVSKELQTKTVLLSQLISQGLPESELIQDYNY